MVKLSICIPYYETYELTKRLLERLIPQLTEETEVILCDDGCNETRLDEFKDYINIVHIEKNQGGAKNTNECIERTIGKYVALIDSDDFISENYVSVLINAINNHDEDLIFMDWKDIANGVVVHHPHNYAPWKCIYKREKMPRFDEDWIYSFDVPFHEKVEALNLSKYYIDKVLYYYNSNREGNLTQKKKEFLKSQKGE